MACEACGACEASASCRCIDVHGPFQCSDYQKIANVTTAGITIRKQIGVRIHIQSGVRTHVREVAVVTKRTAFDYIIYG